MRILFATAHSYLPDRVGGSKRSIHELSLELIGRGIDTTVLSNRSSKPEGQNVVIRDHYGGYTVYRAPKPALAVKTVVNEFRPEVAVVETGLIMPIVNALLRERIPTVVYFRDVQFHDYGGFFLPTDRLLFLANSRFVAERVRVMFGLDCHVIPSVVRLDDYVTESSRTRALFIGSDPLKGLELAFRVAERRPNIPFSFVESWPISPQLRKNYAARASRAGNISWSRPVMDIRVFFAEARLLLVPSICEEASARVVTEAQVSGIPVLASSRGGLPDSVGAGGLVVDPHAPLDDWLVAFDLMWRDEEEYDRLCDAARRHAWRPEIAPDRVAGTFVKNVTDFLEIQRTSG